MRITAYLSYRRIRRYSVGRLKRLEACDFSHVRFTREYKKIRDGYQIKVRNTKEATKIIVEHQDLFTDYEVVKGGMDDVFLAVTGKKLGGER